MYMTGILLYILYFAMLLNKTKIRIQCTFRYELDIEYNSNNNYFVQEIQLTPLHRKAHNSLRRSICLKILRKEVINHHTIKPFLSL